MSDADFRHRVVMLGSNRVGKTAIIKSFLGLPQMDKYRETVEDLYCREYKVENDTVRVDILDTAGNDEFPAMRRLSISTGHAFILVYSVNSTASFQIVCAIYEQLKEIRSDIDQLPIIIVGNKTDLVCERDVDDEDVQRWLEEQGLMRSRLIECSAKEGRNILDIFYRLLQQYPNPQAQKLSPSLRRKMAMHAAARRKNKQINVPVSADSEEPGDDKHKGGSLKVPSNKARDDKRSRSLIRRLSQKAYKGVAFQKESPEELMDNDCCIS